MKRRKVAAGSLDRLVQAAEAAWNRRDFQECIESLQKASRLAPANPGIHLRLGRFYGMRYDYAAAERCFQEALRLAPRKTDMLTAIGDLSRQFRNPDIAGRYFRRAVEQPDATAHACILFADLLEWLGRVPEAAQLVERALALNPADPAALRFRARLERLAGRFEAAEQVLRSCINQPMPDTWTHAQAWYEFAAVLDRLGKFDDAMTALVKAKDLLRPPASKPSAAAQVVRARLETMQADITSELFQRWFAGRAELGPARRLALLCGYARSGTTLLEQVLDAHPDIVAAGEAAVFYDDSFAPLKRHLSPDICLLPDLPILEAADAPALRQARAAYFQFMELALGRPISGHLLLDKNPHLTTLIPAFLRIFPETKLLIALRDPRDVVLSLFMQAQPFDPFTVNNLSLETTVDVYAFTMGLWRTFAPLMPAPYLEIRYEDVVAGLESVARKVLDFLGVAWDDRLLRFHEQARKRRVNSVTYGDLTQPIYQQARGRWRNYRKYLEPHLKKLEPFAKAFGYE